MNIGLKNIENLFKDCAILGSCFMIVTAVAGIAVSAISAVTLGKFKDINHTANVCLFAETPIIANLYYKSVKVLNKNFTAEESILSQPGIISKYISVPIFQAANKNFEQHTAFNRHVIPRALYAVGTCVSPITRTADVALGILVAAVSIVPYFGKNQTINRFAIRQLNLNVIQDVCKGIRGIINPEQFKSEPLLGAKS